MKLHTVTRSLKRNNRRRVFFMNYVCATHLSSMPVEALKFWGGARTNTSFFKTNKL